MSIFTLPNDPAALKAIIADMATKNEAVIADKDTYIAQLEEQIRLFKAAQFLAKSEKAKSHQGEVQYSLFDEAEMVAAEPEKSEIEAVEVTEVAAHTRRKKGRKPIPEAIPRVEVIHDIPDAAKPALAAVS